MGSSELENLVRIGSLQRDAALQSEIDGLIASAEAWLGDSVKASNRLETRFTLAYGAAHALALAALRRAGYRSTSRYLVFQTVEHTLGLPATTCRLLAKAHKVRNRGEYEGVFDLDDRLVTDLIAAARALLGALRGAPMPEG